MKKDKVFGYFFTIAIFIIFSYFLAKNSILKLPTGSLRNCAILGISFFIIKRKFEWEHETAQRVAKQSKYHPVIRFLDFPLKALGSALAMAFLYCIYLVVFFGSIVSPTTYNHDLERLPDDIIENPEAVNQCLDYYEMNYPNRVQSGLTIRKCVDGINGYTNSEGEIVHPYK